MQGAVGTEDSGQSVKDNEREGWGVGEGNNTEWLSGKTELCCTDRRTQMCSSSSNIRRFTE